MPAVKTHTEELRAALIDEAGRLLRTEGSAAITLRRLAKATHTSTAAVYTLFGDKAGLVEHMYVEGFKRLGRNVEAEAPTTDPLDDLLAIGRAYRRSALRSPHLYELMFGRPVPGFVPSAQAKAIAGKSFRPVVVAVSRCIDMGVFRPDTNAEDAAYHVWALGHGLVMLEIHRILPMTRATCERRYLAALSRTVDSYVTTPSASQPTRLRAASYAR